MVSASLRAEKYRSKAEEVRIIAESMKDDTVRTMLLTVAQDYLALAKMLDDGHELRHHLADPSEFKL